MVAPPRAEQPPGVGQGRIRRSPARRNVSGAASSGSPGCVSYRTSPGTEIRTRMRSASPPGTREPSDTATRTSTVP
ncbi:MAG TPA: hypothetical protein VGB28_03365, partial [Actinomycetota bacterium]